MRTIKMMLIGAMALTTTITKANVREAFANPSPETKLHFWYHWRGDQVSEDGIVRDFAALSQLDVGTVSLVVPNGYTPGLPNSARTMSPEWLHLVEVAIREAKKYGMTFGFHNCPGWSSSGGPWITPENAMKFLTNSQTDITNPSGRIKLPQPTAPLGWYRDIAVLAFPLAADERPIRVTNDFGGNDAAFMTRRAPFVLPVKEPGSHASITLEYAEPIAAKNLLATIDKVRCIYSRGTLEVSDDGQSWQKAGNFEFMRSNVPGQSRSVRLDAKARGHRFFRVTFNYYKQPPWNAPDNISLSALGVTGQPLVNRLLTRTAMENQDDITYDDPAERGIVRDSIVDLTKAMTTDGTLELAALAAKPAVKQWRIVRIGYAASPTGPGPSTIKGLECDKLRKAGIEAHWAGMPAKILALKGAKGTVGRCHIDSYEVGGQNWCEGFEEEFARRRGKPIGENLLVLCGYLVGTPAETDAFTRDFRQTISDLYAENYYRRFTELCHENGLVSSAQCYGGAFDTLQCATEVDIPEGECWNPPKDNGFSIWTPRAAASVAHLNGKRLVACESFTTMKEGGRWMANPHDFRKIGDIHIWAEGVNAFTIHSYCHQPTNAVPGVTLGMHGSQFNGNTTYWKECAEWAKYVRRGQALLQYGEPVADILVVSSSPQPELTRAGFTYDLCRKDDLARTDVVTRYRHIIRNGEKPLESVRGANLVPSFTGRGLKGVCRAGADGTRIWFLANGENAAFQGPVRLMAPEGTLPELFDAKTGKISALACRRVEDGRAEISLSLPAYGSAFIVFTRDAKPFVNKPEPVRTSIDLSKGWRIAAFEGLNAPEAPRTADPLFAWNESSDEKLRYFSGRAKYVRELSAAESEAIARGSAWLELGMVREVAVVRLDGREIGCLWEEPYRVELPSGMAKQLQVEVINRWPNRLIGDAIARSKGEPTFTWTTYPQAFSATDPLLESGLIGPVKLEAAFSRDRKHPEAE